MCDYSLHDVASRPAKVGDKLVTSEFQHTITRGFTGFDDPNVAVCLLPGTELAFEGDVRYNRAFSLFGTAKVACHTARFTKVNQDDPHDHHDALEFANGQVVLLTRLLLGQRATVLQLPAEMKGPIKGNATETIAPASPRSIMEHGVVPRRHAAPEEVDR